jgi:hypothetical protein
MNAFVFAQTEAGLRPASQRLLARPPQGEKIGWRDLVVVSIRESTPVSYLQRRPVLVWGRVIGSHLWERAGKQEANHNARALRNEADALHPRAQRLLYAITPTSKPSEGAVHAALQAPRFLR